ncbi:hypothetical protein DSO57_1004911 [Entomophthora muscae]|uniref:Uncharacterized protein n=1 Tax=Entomophthora muscae TaxID=34485 RepID=A0ACC2SL51_9FUNG|nr:hypothetical protein DSO57_1004911 [Entomophthora muscae]
MKKIPADPPLPEALPAQDFRLANQVVSHTGSWHPWDIEANYLVRIAPIVCMAFQAWPAAPVGVQLETNMGWDIQGVARPKCHHP